MKPEYIDITDVPGFIRMAYRDVVDLYGGDVTGYEGGYFGVALPQQPELSGLCQTLRNLGLDCVRMAYFPLGSDRAPEQQRHFGPGTAAAPRGQRPGYWLFAKFAVRREALDREAREQQPH